MDDFQRWRKSSRSEGVSNCVELACTLTAMRDSKNPDGPVLRVGRTAVADLLAAVKGSEFGG